MTNASELTAKLRPGLGSGRLLSTRRGMITAAALAALAGLGVVLLFMSSYRTSVSPTAEMTVLVADTFIEKGTSGDAIAEAELFRRATLPEDEVRAGAITDPSALSGHVVSKEVASGQQLTTAELVPGADPVVGRLQGVQRALSVPVDPARGNFGQLQPGTHVDVLGSFAGQIAGGRATTMVEPLARDILVLQVPGSEGSDTGAAGDAVVLRVTDVEATRIAEAADSGEIWLTVRPPTLGEDSDIDEIRQEGAPGQGVISLPGG